MNKEYVTAQIRWPEDRVATLSAKSIADVLGCQVSDIRPDHCPLGSVNKITDGIYSIEITTAAMAKARKAAGNGGIYICEMEVVQTTDRQDLKRNPGMHRGIGTLGIGH